MSYTPAQVAKTITAGVIGAGAVALGFAQALADGVIRADEWSLLIPLITNAIVTTIGVFYVPNGTAGDNVEVNRERGASVVDLIVRLLAALVAGLLVYAAAFWLFVSQLGVQNGELVATLLAVVAALAVAFYWKGLNRNTL